jgi:hypothetical protein
MALVSSDSIWSLRFACKPAASGCLSERRICGTAARIGFAIAIS